MIGVLNEGNKMASEKRKKVGLALGGGGARGFAHIGALKVFEEESIPIDFIAGTSIGSVVGGAYASGLGPGQLVEKVKELMEGPLAKLSIFKAMGDSPEQKEMGLARKIGLFFKGQWLFTQALFNPGMIEDRDFQSVINHFIPDIGIEDTKIPFRAVAVDLITGKEVVLSTGSMREAIMASCAVPGFMPPVKRGDMLLVDGGTVNIMPCSIARRCGADVVIGIDVDRDINADQDFNNAIDVYTRAAMIGSYHLAAACVKEADVLIRPQVGDMKWFELKHSMDVIREGEHCARESMGRIRDLIPVRKERKMLSIIRHIFGKESRKEPSSNRTKG